MSDSDRVDIVAAGEPDAPTVERTSAAWDDRTLSDPHGTADKHVRVRSMFSAIASSYDLNNRVHSLGMDQRWRRRAVAISGAGTGDVVLDLACGTGDLTLAFAEAGVRRAIGLDFTEPMVALAPPKAACRPASADRAPSDFGVADAMRLPVADRSVDVVSIAFGIRNVADPARAMREFARVLRPGGRLIILEFTQPTAPVLGPMYRFYFKHVLPRSAALIARDRSGAYRYLPRSVDTFLTREALKAMMAETGFEAVTTRSLTLGIACVYRGVRRGGAS